VGASNGHIYYSDPDADQVEALRRLCRVSVTTVALPSGWRRSRATKLEALVARALGKQVVEGPNLKPVPPSVLDTVRLPVAR